MTDSYDQVPGRMNLAFSRGDNFSALIDFFIADLDAAFVEASRLDTP